MTAQDDLLKEFGVTEKPMENLPIISVSMCNKHTISAKSVREIESRLPTILGAARQFLDAKRIETSRAVIAEIDALANALKERLHEIVQSRLRAELSTIVNGCFIFPRGVELCMEDFAWESEIDAAWPVGERLDLTDFKTLFEDAGF